MKRFVIIIFLFLLFGDAIRAFRIDYLQDSKIHVLDHKYHNEKDINKLGILFRTNTPLTYFYKEFNYDYLFSKLEYAAARERQIELKKENSYIVFFNLIGDDEDVLTKEREFFESNPRKGEVRWRPMLGEISSPDYYTDKEIEMKVKDMSWMKDDIGKVVDEIRELLITPPPFSIQNLIIIIHCRRGKDRTGQLSGSYQLKYGHKNWEQTQALNWEVYNGRLVYQHQRALVWYCYRLKHEENYPFLSCTHENISPDRRSTPKLLGWNAPLYYQFSGLSLSTLLLTLLVSIIVNCLLFRQFVGKQIFRQVPCFFKIIEVATKTLQVTCNRTYCDRWLSRI